jgi:hypothetical protein
MDAFRIARTFNLGTVKIASFHVVGMSSLGEAGIASLAARLLD